MLARQKQVNTIKSIRKLSENGLISAGLNLGRPPGDIADIKYLPEKMANETTFMQEFPQKNKKLIYKDKLNTSLKNIRVMKLSKILEADLTSKEKDSEKYWNSYTKEISERLSYPPKIDLADLERMNYSSGCLVSSEENLQYLANEHLRVVTRSSQKNYLKLSRSLPQDTTGGEATQITRKVRIYPNNRQKELFNKCFGAHNYFYNRAVEALKENSKLKLTDFRKLFIPRDTELTEENLWMKDIPLDTREEAARKAIAAQKTGFTQIKVGMVKHFQLSFRSKRFNNPVFYVAKKALINGGIFSNRLKKDKYLVTKNKGDEQFLKESDGIFSIVKEKDGRYYVCIIVKPTDQKLRYNQKIIALDPGIRTFQTAFSESSVGEFGYDTSKKLYNLYRRENKLKSVLAKDKNARENVSDVTKDHILKSNKRCKLKKRCALLRTKAKHIVNDLHWKTSDYLTKNYQVILLPIFNTKQMANRANRKIGRTTTRLMLGLRHYDFQQKILYKAKQRGRNVIICREHYTSKCCGNCGELNQKLGSKKIFSCSNCNLLIDRDIHAARNILLRALSIYLAQLSDTIQSVKKPSFRS